jgi:hypothetical protein
MVVYSSTDFCTVVWSAAREKSRKARGGGGGGDPSLPSPKVGRMGAAGEKNLRDSSKSKRKLSSSNSLAKAV